MSVFCLCSFKSGNSIGEAMFRWRWPEEPICRSVKGLGFTIQVLLYFVGAVLYSIILYYIPCGSTSCFMLLRKKTIWGPFLTILGTVYAAFLGWYYSRFFQFKMYCSVDDHVKDCIIGGGVLERVVPVPNGQLRDYEWPFVRVCLIECSVNRIDIFFKTPKCISKCVLFLSQDR